MVFSFKTAIIILSNKRTAETKKICDRKIFCHRSWRHKEKDHPKQIILVLSQEPYKKYVVEAKSKSLMCRSTSKQSSNKNNNQKIKPKPFSLFSQLYSIQHEMTTTSAVQSNQPTDRATHQPSNYVLHVCLPSSANCCLPVLWLSIQYFFQ